MLAHAFPLDEEGFDEMPSLNHSYVCSRILRQLFKNESIEALTELTLDIEKGLTPDICVYPVNVIQPNFFRDIKRVSQMPVLAIEVISSSQNIQDLLEKAEKLVNAGVKAVWTIEPYTRSIFVTTEAGERILYNQVVEIDNVSVDFQAIFGA